MPFLLNESQQKFLNLPIVWDPITGEMLMRYQKSFDSRYERLAANGFNFIEDCEIRKIHTQCFHDLVHCAPEDSYLVAQYICDDSRSDFKNMRLAFCIKIPVDGAADDMIHDKIYDEQGNCIDFETFVELTCNYLKRKAIINKRAKLECQWDCEGRAHKLDADTKKAILSILVDSERNFVDFYARFILDDYLNRRDTLSVVFFTDKNILVQPEDSQSPVGYDHGTACCPIG